jgi:hypothetical protein
MAAHPDSGKFGMVVDRSYEYEYVLRLAFDGLASSVEFGNSCCNSCVE